VSSNNTASSGGAGKPSALLYVVLLCVLAAFALLVVALVSTQTLWAWGSVALSVVGAAVLLLDWQRRRRTGARPPENVAAAAEPTVGGEDDDADADPQEDAGGPGETQATGDLDSPATGGVRIGTNRDDRPEPADPEPAEEDTDAADALVVSELTDEVLVLDERPRYHLAGCGWVGDRPTIPLPVNEARQLGFTPCARCAPDATLAAHTRR
jgi:hypothetical protein